MVLFADILTKQLVVNFMIERQSIPIINNFFYLTYARNKGIAFSLLEGKLVFIIIMTILVIGIIIKYIKDSTATSIEIICYSLVIGGAIGNLLDRIIYGYVIDFLDFHLFHYNFPIFNLADSCIVIGIFFLLLMNFKESEGKNANHSRSTNKD